MASFIPLMNSFNQTEAAFFPYRLCSLGAFPSISLFKTVNEWFVSGWVYCIYDVTNKRVGYKCATKQRTTLGVIDAYVCLYGTHFPLAKTNVNENKSSWIRRNIYKSKFAINLIRLERRDKDIYMTAVDRYINCIAEKVYCLH